MKSEQKLDAILLDLGHDDLCIGTDYIRTAVRNYRPGMFMTKELYPAIAKAHDSTPQRVERAMRHSIEKAWTYRGSDEARLKYFGNSVSIESGRPMLGEYVARLARLCREGVGE